ncbi:MAG: SGNH/GDSL hydrolase family protein [Agriterribacter sp.]
MRAPQLLNQWSKQQREMLLLFAFLLSFARVAMCNQAQQDSIVFHDARQFVIIGQCHNEKNYQRLPMRYKGIVRDQVWMESLCSAGISIRFRTNATTIHVKWKLPVYEKSWNHSSSGVDGIDLYAYNGNGWQYVNTGLAKDTANDFILIHHGDAVYREYLLNLPLYNTALTLSIGINAGATIDNPQQKLLTEKKPVVYYGSSIAQGGSASRPGLAYTNILSRKLDRSFMNMGFNGEGTFDSSVGLAMSDIDAALFIIDCTPNSKKEIIYQRAVALVKLLKEKKPTTPVLLVEGYHYDNTFFEKNGAANVDAKRAELKKAYDTLIKAGIKELYYKKGDGLTGSDHEATIDGVHLDDIGMQRFAEQMLPMIQLILK